jgi:hypothetical protein
MKNRNILYALIALAVLTILVFVFRNPNKSNSNGASSPQAKEYSFVLKDKKLVSGPDKMDVTEGDHVKITLSSDVDYPELHLHGYELKTAIKKDFLAILDFTANKTGSYILEIHFVEDKASANSSSSDSSASGNELQIGHLEVQPK